MKAAGFLGYVPDRLAAAFSPDQSSTLVRLCVPRLTSGLFGHVLHGVVSALGRPRYLMVIGSKTHFADKEEAWLREVVSGRPAGVILSGRT